MVEALTFTIETFSGLPVEFRPDNNITDMKRLLGDLEKQDASIAQEVLSTADSKMFSHTSRRPNSP
jgi:hypothetical protein